MTTSSVWRIRDFRLLVIGQGLSWLGDAFNPIALSVAIVIDGGGAHELGLILASAVIARLLCTLLGGVWADRLAPHWIMVGTDLIRFASAGGMALAFALGTPPTALLAALAAITSGAGAFFFPALVSLRPLIVPSELRQSGNATISLLQSSTQVAGPILAGFLVAQLGSVLGFAINAATFLWSAGASALIRTPAEGRSERGSMLREIGEGLAEIRSRDWLWSGLASAAMFHVGSGILVVLIEITVVRDLGGATSLGWLSAAQGVGGIIGGLVALRYLPRRMLLAGFLALGTMPLLPLGFAWPGALPGILVLAVIAQAGLMFFSVGWDTALQEGVPHERLARVASWDILISFIAMPIGNLLAGVIGASLPTRTVMLGVAVWMLVAGCWPLAIRGIRTFTRDEQAAAGEGATQERAAATAS